MKIGITSDLHLTTSQQNPERFAALENIFAQLNRLAIAHLIIAGDLFDVKYDNFAEFESICRLPANRHIRIYIIPGNHDVNISQSGITVENVRVISKPEIVSFDSENTNFLFLPYLEGKSMGDMIQVFSNTIESEKWVLIGHGDWLGNVKDVNPYEPGIYMPLSQRDLDTYKPSRVFLGHIHASYNGEKVYYAGSPCSIDITETGRRYFLIFDTLSNNVENRIVDTAFLNFNKTFTVFPMENETDEIEVKLKGWVDAWGLTPEEKPKARVRVKFAGYSNDKNVLNRVIKNTLSDFQLYEEPDLSEVSLNTDSTRGYIVNLVSEKINQSSWMDGIGIPDKDQVLLDAIRIIYRR